MSSITIELPKERVRQLKELAAQYGVSAEELVRVSVEELLEQPEEQLRRAAEFVLKKNAELYKRLAA